MVISVMTYEQIALEAPDGFWELDCGHLRQKPGMTYEHTDTTSRLAGQLFRQLEPEEFAICVDGPRLRIRPETFYLPNLTVVPRAFMQRARRERPGRLDIFEEAMPLVVEVWSPSTGEYDVDVKLRQYQWRGDAEIWRIHPYDRTLTAWRLQPDGNYSETVYREGIVEPVALFNVRIELKALFE